MTVRAVIVDDSATMRAVISATLRSDPEIEVVGEAADPHEARQLIKLLSPDVITLDIEMPNMDGLSFLEKIMRLRPTPVVMVSTLTQAGAETSLRALEIGAFDCVAKPSAAVPDSFTVLADRVKAAAQAGRKPRPLARPREAAGLQNYAPDGRIVAIGSSTGGVEALIEILSKFPRNCPPTIISQHMPPTFTKSFAARLDKLCHPSVREAETGQRLEVGHIYLAPGDQHLEITGRSLHSINLSHAGKVNGHRPSVDVMFYSVARVAGAQALGVILTGLGADGAQGLLALREAGAQTIGQDAASSVVYGMPRAAFELGAVMRQWPLEKIGLQILNLTNARQKVPIA
ncbi:protein-glutamate methylesterase/protein-glutamine glutaminase [Acidocella aminolytica]|uniref:Protein-glutamate methylesterase/protein-glutamine glutaminase n=1 Tax=Acidocella aminolytica 101 = DSM 11237 TaxID=1120923 RepID=A0A0D6PC35_9PROT|nr:chemotaxis response regulator protein-glutamate methylesterase [Acidocella aminolytica]GAN79217.1 response regulator receiver modulated CheB methylesterase [Acidocella aminolytica 101 = DSM 11237]GBQ44554.1 chemotaxis protein CheB [Acidocella aminolytica 101 = DSM 11237]SHE92164.1 two-component system, chemotaxis family, response regulator CheB [Acidocella aminolytica 101 = DSM 11237]